MKGDITVVCKRGVGGGLDEKTMFEESRKGEKGVSHEYHWKENAPSRGKSQGKGWGVEGVSLGRPL